MKVLIITQAFYPGINPRSFRATELAKELARQGDEVIVYAELREFDHEDFSRKTNVTIHDIPLRFQSNKTVEQQKKPGLLKRAFNKAMHVLIEYPDVEFVWKIKPILKKEKDVDLLITIAYPHPIHWGTGVAKALMKDGFPRKWIADCGDPYAGNKTEPHPFYFKYVERFWGKQSDAISIPIEDAKSAYESCLWKRIVVIPQGFDFSGLQRYEEELNHSCPHFAYAGVVYPGRRDPTMLLKYLCEIDKDFVFTVYTKSGDYYNRFKEKLGQKLIISPYIPREQLLYELSKQDFLINLTNVTSTQVPSKLIDYSYTKRPFINISADFREKDVFEEFLNGDYTNACRPVDLSQFDIKNVAKDFKRAVGLL